MKKKLANTKKYIKKLLSSKRNRMIIISAFFIVVLITACIIIFAPKKEDEKTILKKKITELGRDFYENFYYDLITEEHGIDQISKFDTVGVKANLKTLEKYKKENEKKMARFKKNKCNMENTKVIIYPKKPYGKKDYKIEVKLDCKLDKK